MSLQHPDLADSQVTTTDDREPDTGCRSISKGFSSGPERIDPSDLAFDVDGVIADTMSLFLRILWDEFRINGITLEDIHCYALDECLDLEPRVIQTAINQIIDGTYRSELTPLPGAQRVLTRIGRRRNPILLITARPKPGPIEAWIRNLLSPGGVKAEIMATGSFEAKMDILKARGINHFVEDRLETCHLLEKAGITPILFQQPWNRAPHPFAQVASWEELEDMIDFS